MNRVISSKGTSTALYRTQSMSVSVVGNKNKHEMSVISISKPPSSMSHTLDHNNNTINKMMNNDKRTKVSKFYDSQFADIIVDNHNNNNNNHQTNINNTNYLPLHSQLTENYIESYQSSNKTHKIKELEVQLKIWKLLKYLRIAEQTQQTQTLERITDFEKYFSPKTHVSYVFSTDIELLKMTNIIQWLEDLAPNAVYLKNGEISFKRTMTLKKHYADNNNNNNNNGNNDDNTNTSMLLTSMDPDIIIRNNISMHTLKSEEIQDFQEEEQLLTVVWQLIRKGSIKEATQLCRNYGQFWRAASMNGSTLFEDNLMKRESTSTHGNSDYLLWLQTCKVIANQSKSFHEQLIYAMLCGDIQILIKNYIRLGQNSHIWFEILWVLLKTKELYKKYEILTGKYKNSGKNPSYIHSAAKLKEMHEISTAAANANADSELESELDSNANNAKKNTAQWLITDIINHKWNERLSDFKSIFEIIEEIQGNPNTFNIYYAQQQRTQTQPQSGGKENNMQLMNIAKQTNDRRLAATQQQRRSSSNQPSSVHSNLMISYNEEYYQIIKCLITNNTQQLLENAHSFIIGDDNDNNNKQITLEYQRFIIHLVLYLKPLIVVNANADANENNNNRSPSQLFLAIVKQFIRNLIQRKQYSEICKYCLILSENDLIASVSAFLLSLDDPPIREYLFRESKNIYSQVLILRIRKEITSKILDHKYGGIPEMVDQSALVQQQQQQQQQKQQNAWKSLKKCQMLSDFDGEKIDSLCFLCQENDSMKDSLLACNSIFAFFAKEYKEEGMILLLNKISPIIVTKENNDNRRTLQQQQQQQQHTAQPQRHLDSSHLSHMSHMSNVRNVSVHNNDSTHDIINIQRNMSYLECHFHTFNDWELYVSVLQWYYTWYDCHLKYRKLNKNKNRNRNMNSNSASTTVLDESEQQNRQRLIVSIRQMFAGNHEWLNSKQCLIQDWNAQQLLELRGVIIKRVLQKIYYFVNGTKEYAFILSICRIFANPEYNYSDCMDAHTIQELLQNAKDAQIHILAAKQKRRQ